MKVKTTLIETLVYQLSSTHIFVWPGATKVKTTLMYIQTLVYNNCHRRSSSFNQKKVQSQDNSHTNTCLPTLILIWPGAKSQSQDNSHTNSFFTNCHRLSSSSDQEQRAEVKTTLIQTLCLPTLIGSHPRLTRSKELKSRQLSYKLFVYQLSSALILVWPGAKSWSQDNSHTNSLFTNSHRLSSSFDRDQRWSK